MLEMMNANVYALTSAKNTLYGLKNWWRPLSKADPERMPVAVPASPAPDAQYGGNDHQHRDNNDGRQYLGKDQVGLGIDAHDLLRIDLLAHPHIAQLAGDLAADDPGQHDTDKRGREFQDHRIPDDLCNGWGINGLTS